MSSCFNAVDLFSGAGGMSCGFEQAGFRILAGNDLMAAAGDSFKLAHPGAEFYLRPIERVSGKELLLNLGIAPGALDCLIGGPPCQAFSVYNHKRSMDDGRSQLFRHYVRLVSELRPKTLVMENVTGMLSLDGGLALRQAINSLSSLGYKVEHRVLKAEEFGVPQERRRVFLVGVSPEVEFDWPPPTHGKGKKPFVTVEEAISDLPIIENGGGREGSPYTSAPKSDFQKQMRTANTGLSNHVAPKLGEVNLQRLRHIPQGGSWRDIPFDLLPEGMKRAKRSDHTKRYGRLHPKGLASTILTKCDIHWGAYIHPYQDRGISVREAARFQSFPDSFRFTGSKTDQFVQVGNAVPPLLARAVALQIIKSLRQAVHQPSLFESAI